MAQVSPEELKAEVAAMEKRMLGRMEPDENPENAKPAQPPAKRPETNFAILKAPATLPKVIRANVGDVLSPFDLERIRVPTGGGTVWELPGLEGTDVQKSFPGIILHFRDDRRFWSQSFDQTGGGIPPDCLSENGEVGIGDPGGPCLACPHAAWGSREGESRGQACRAIRLLFVARPDEILPCVVTVPPTSLRPIRQFFLRLASKAVAFYAIVVKFELVKTSSKGGLAYSQIVPTIERKLRLDEVEAVEELRKALIPSLKKARMATNTDFAD